MKQLLRTIDRWRFELPLAVALGAAAGFAMVAMPRDALGQVPAAAGLGASGRLGLALIAAIVSGFVAYAAMREAGKPRVAVAEPIDDAIDEEPEGAGEDRLRRVRRADSHPDAPPRAPIRASRDLGEPFMEVAPETPPVQSAPVADAMPDAPIPDGDYVEIDDEFIHWSASELSVEFVEDAAPVATTRPAEPVPVSVDRPAAEPAAAPEAAVSPETVVRPEPVVTTAVSHPEAPFRPARESLSAMMDRLASGLERRAQEGRGASGIVPAGRNMQPALREALNELNRLAARRA